MQLDPIDDFVLGRWAEILGLMAFTANVVAQLHIFFPKSVIGAAIIVTVIFAVVIQGYEGLRLVADRLEAGWRPEG